MSDEALLSRLKENSNEAVHQQITRCLKSMTGSLHNLSKFDRRFPSEWSIDCATILLNLVEAFRPSNEIRLLAYFILMSLSNASDHLERLVELDYVITDVVELIARCSSRISLDENLERRYYTIESEGIMI